MDDDAPLSTLAKAPKIDDDTPLASLAKKAIDPKVASRSPGKPGGAASPGKVGAPGGALVRKPSVAKGIGRPTPTKRKAVSSSSSSSSSDSSSSTDSDEAKPLKKKAKSGTKKLKNRAAKIQKAQTEEDFDGGGEINKRDRTPKQQVVADLLCRWWYALPPWPPTDPAYYEKTLAERGYRRVALVEWEWVLDEVDGRKKCYELSQFPGLFRASTGELLDTRPKETCPCFTNLMKKELPDLYDLLVTAFENQLKALETSKYNEKNFENELKARLAGVRKKAYDARQMTVRMR